MIYLFGKTHFGYGRTTLFDKIDGISGKAQIVGRRRKRNIYFVGVVNTLRVGC